MDKLTLNSLSPYLPHKLFIRWQHDNEPGELGFIDLQVHGLMDHERKGLMFYNPDFGWIEVNFTTLPILRNIEDITVSELADFFDLNDTLTIDKFQVYKGQPIWDISYVHEDPRLNIERTGRTHSALSISFKDDMPIHEWEWMFNHKFDVFGLIPKQMAIDAKTLDKNPYIA